MVRYSQVLLAILLTASLPGAVFADGFFAASYGNVFGGGSPATTGSYSLAIGGTGAHGIGAELEFSDTRNFFQTSGGEKFGRVLTLMPSIFVEAPISRVKPYGIFGFGFIVQRTGSDDDLFSTLSDEEIGYSAGGGVTFQISPRFGVRGDFRHFKVRQSDGLSFQRMMFGVVIG
jgi:Outer membrane protein beta-barrel domain